MLPIYRELIAAGLRIWVFSGDADSVVPLTATRYSIDALYLPTVTNWYPWYDDEEVSQQQLLPPCQFCSPSLFYAYYLLMV
jgi:serine carboxypeptidase-like clade 2